MSRFPQLLHHPAGRIGITMGLLIGFLAAVAGEASKALFFVGVIRFLASRMKK